MNEETQSQVVWEGRYLSMAKQGPWEYATRAKGMPGVGIVAITDREQVVLVEQYRIPIGRRVIELPAGLSGDTLGSENELILDAAKRELLEETGYHAQNWTELIAGYSSPGLTDETLVLFLAEGLQKVGPGGGDASEEIQVHEVDLNQVLPWLVEQGQNADLKLLSGLYAVEQHRQRNS